MVTTTTEGMHLVAILLRYVSRKRAYQIVSDMEFEIGETTENTSLRDSIKMVRGYLET
jgi:hypothetical protein|tara:strand:- start:1162 stop:1335 length:174 start_codon:yes stop_codon:yes gene_type:complete